MFQAKRLAIALLTLTLYACTTKVGVPVKLQLSDDLRALCQESLPPLRAEVGEDMRKALLQNRAESQVVYAQCRSHHKNTLRAVGIEPGPAEVSNEKERWDIFQDALKSLPTEKGRSK